MRTTTLIAVAAALALAGCGAKPRYENRRPDPVSALVLGTTLPGTQVWVDGQMRGTTGTAPLEITVADGTREVRLVAPGGRETSLTAFIQNGSRRMIDPAQAFAQ
jgi:hypothetical protein